MDKPALGQPQLHVLLVHHAQGGQPERFAEHRQAQVAIAGDDERLGASVGHTPQCGD